MPKVDSDKILQQAVQLLERASDKLDGEIKAGHDVDGNFVTTAAEIRGFLSASEAFEYVERTAPRRDRGTRGLELEVSEEPRPGELHGNA